MGSLSVIIPALNEQACIVDTLQRLQPLRRRGHEVILADGGSRDDTRSLCHGLVDRTVCSERGRALQMNAGAAQARGTVLLFLHADTQVPEDIDRQILQALADKSGWGRFDIRLSGNRPVLRLVEMLMNLRSRWTGIATGDQGLFVTVDLFRQLGGFPEQPLMEDIDLSRKLKRLARPHCLRARLVTSSRRWECQGVMTTITRMWLLRLAYFFGVPAERLARHYEQGT